MATSIKDAQDAATLFLANIGIAAEKSAIVGSLRRVMSYRDSGGVVSVDWTLPLVELLILPKHDTYKRLKSADLFGEYYEEIPRNLFEERLPTMFKPETRVVSGGVDMFSKKPVYHYSLHEYPLVKRTETTIDLYIKNPNTYERVPCRIHLVEKISEWGVAMVVRTGPEEFVARLPDLLPPNCNLRRYTAEVGGRDEDYRTEAEVFAMLGLSDPEDYAPHKRKFIGVEEEQ